MDTINAIVETPKGSEVKYTYEPSSGFFLLKKVLPAGMVFPHDFGFIPETKGEDGDPLDIVIISEFKNHVGCKIECRLIGSLQAMQSSESGKKDKIRNDRFLGIPIQSVIFENVKTMRDLPEKFLTELKAFFIQYNKMEKKIFEIETISNAQKSLGIIKKSRTAKLLF
jgi:inorganic pyrophosphatase